MDTPNAQRGRFAHAFSLTMLFPFLPFMIQFLVPGVDETAVGVYGGVVGGALFAGRIFGSYIWGVVADKKGRKPVILWSGILTSICVLAFGFSVNLAMAIIIRFLMGCVNGTVTSVKAMISEASEDRFQAFGLSIIGAAWSMGFVVGPAVSGAIADPVGQYNLTITNSFLRSYLTKFPYSLPCIVNILLFIVGLLPVAFCLPETLGKKRNYKRSEINQTDLKVVQNKLNAEKDICQGSAELHYQESKIQSTSMQLEEDEVEKHVEYELNNNSSIQNIGINQLKTISAGQHENSKRCKESSRSSGNDEIEVGGDEGGSNIGGNDYTKVEQEIEERSSLSKLKFQLKSLKKSVQSSLKDVSFFMCYGTTLIPLVLYMVYSFVVIGYNEIFSIWAFTQPHYGGLGFSLHEIGIALTIVGALQFPVNLFGFAILEKYLKSIKVFYIGATILIFTVPMLPHLHYLAADASPTWSLWILLIAVAWVLSATSSLLFSATFLFINNSVTFDKLGSINGLAVCLTSTTRCIAPVLSGLFFSLTLSETTLKIGFPLDYNFIFVMFSVIYLSCVFLVACLPESINHQKIIEDI